MLDRQLTPHPSLAAWGLTGHKEVGAGELPDSDKLLCKGPLVIQSRD